MLLNKNINFETKDNLEEIKSKWIETFAGHLTEKERRKIYMNSYLWHLFSYDKTKYLEGNKARKAFDELKDKEYYIFYEDYAYNHDILEYKNKVFEVLNCNEIKAEYFNEENDIYIVDKYFKWTYVNTHEEYCGPYFCKL